MILSRHLLSPEESNPLMKSSRGSKCSFQEEARRANKWLFQSSKAAYAGVKLLYKSNLSFPPLCFQAKSDILVSPAKET